MQNTKCKMEDCLHFAFRILHFSFCISAKWSVAAATAGRGLAGQSAVEEALQQTALVPAGFAAGILARIAGRGGCTPAASPRPGRIANPRARRGAGARGNRSVVAKLSRHPASPAHAT